MLVEDLGLMPYRDAWAHQERVHLDVVAGGEERVLLVEHPPVITCGRRPNVAKNLLASSEQLQKLGIEFVESDRGGDITFHGPGQLVAYPIVRLIDHFLSVGGYVRRLEQAVIAALGDLGIEGRNDDCAVGVWVDQGTIPARSPEPTRPRPADAGGLAKICALGVRVRRGVTMHGIALNVTTDLSYFNLIIPCGLSCRPVTSIEKCLPGGSPSMEAVKRALARRLLKAFAPVDATSAAP
ncbi:MAG TPA: lipoyl(octanoyl) transferase LipB [Tepidisphaeraceae bacterium]|nr:lipoyl(octanoyl) transferase LipB [Tepidisphaeraceae bacterium]